MQPDDKNIDLVLADEADYVLDCVSIQQVSRELNSFALSSRSRIRLQLFVKSQAILFKENGEGSVCAGGKCRVRWKSLHHGDRLELRADAFVRRIAAVRARAASGDSL